MSARRALVAGAVVVGALVAAVLIIALRPDAGAEIEAARAAETAAISAPETTPIVPSAERGRPAHVARFGPDVHGGHRQSWSVAQAPDGVIYVANSDGVLEYDGVVWRLISVPNYRARAVTIGPSSAVHVAGEGTLGVLAPDSTGRRVYREIAGDALLNGSIVWAAVSYDNDDKGVAGGVLFQAFDQLIVVENGAVVDVHRAPEGFRFHKAFEAGGAAYVRLEGTGLFRYLNRELVPVEGGEQFADVPVRALADLDGHPGGALLAVTNDELFRIEPGAPEPFVPVLTAATEALRLTRAYHGCPVGPPPDAGGALAVTTMGGGVIVVRPDGQVIERLGEVSGLTPDDLVLGCATDAQGGLWLALSEAVARVDAAAPLTALDADLGLDGVVYSVNRSGGQIYAGTGRGIYRLRPSTDGSPATFESVRYKGGDVGQAWALMDFATDPTGSTDEAELLVAGTDGVVSIQGLTTRSILPETAFTLAHLDKHAEAPVYVGLLSGLAILRRENGAWRAEARAEGVTGEVRAILSVEGGAWVAEAGGRLLRITDQGEVEEAFGPFDGVPEGLASVQEIGGSLAVLAADGPYRVERTPGGVRFAPMSGLAEVVEEVVDDLAEGYGIRTDAAGRVWVSGRDRTRAVVPTEDGGWRDVTPPALRQVGGVKGVLAEVDEDVLWVATTDGLLRLGGDAGRYGATVAARVGAIEAGGPVPIEGQAATIPYGSPVRFRFAAAAFNGPPRYRTQLLGHDAAPSAWSSETWRDYTNLPPGDYAFRVEAMTAQDASARPATVAVHVPAPWYLTPWAALLAALVAGAGVAGVAVVASGHQRRRADAQQARADELDRLNAELRHADELKDTMLANASHELRTPLTAVLGFSEILADHPDENVSGLAQHMLSGSRRLLHTVNDILDIARLRSGRVELVPVEADAAEVARSVAAELRPLALKKGVALLVHADGPIPATLDPSAFARVVTNLISNGVKFTERGTVTVTVGAEGREVVLDVADTGCGMAPEFLPRLYETFEQESTGYRRAAEGSGLGMSITARLVELMDGTITVESEPGEGTTFQVRVPGARPVGLGEAMIARSVMLPSPNVPASDADDPDVSAPPDPSAPTAVPDGDGWGVVATGGFWPTATPAEAEEASGSSIP